MSSLGLLLLIIGLILWGLTALNGVGILLVIIGVVLLIVGYGPRLRA